MTNNSINTNNPITIAQGGFGGTTATTSFNNVSPNTTKGDLIVHNGTNNVRLGVGANNLVFTANSVATEGVNWAAGSFMTSAGISSNSLTITSSPITTSGTIGVNLPASMQGSNMVINGDFQVWQRGAGGSATFTGIAAGTTLYTADRWQCQISGTGNGYFNQTAGTTSGSYRMRMGRTVGNTGTGNWACTTSLTRDMCIGAAGNVLAISYKAVCGANYSPTSSVLSVSVYSGTGSSDVSSLSTGFTGLVQEYGVAQVVTTSLQSFSGATATLATNVTQLAVYFGMNPTGTAGADDWVEITDVKLEISPQATPFERKSFSEELKQCQYFFQKTFNYTVAPADNRATGSGEFYSFAAVAGSTANLGTSLIFSRPMRVAPTITAYTPNSATAGRGYNLTRTTVLGGAVSVSNVMQWHVRLGSGTTTAGTVAGDQLQYNFIFDSELT